MAGLFLSFFFNRFFLVCFSVVVAVPFISCLIIAAYEEAVCHDKPFFSL